jgi:diketogulonate reductase-like aldo/keto reductase
MISAVQLHNKDHEPERVPEACKETLRDLQIEQLDLYLMHWPVAVKQGPTVDPPIKVIHPCLTLLRPETWL